MSRRAEHLLRVMAEVDAALQEADRESLRIMGLVDFSLDLRLLDDLADEGSSEENIMERLVSRAHQH